MTDFRDTPGGSSNPDLDESINVTSAHAHDVASSAAAREPRNPGSNHQPLSIGVFVVFALIFVAAGWVLGNNEGAFFSYDAKVKPGYVRAKAPGVADEVVLPPKPILDVYVKKGAAIYSKCIGCHGADGKGDGANYPPLAGSKWALGQTERFALIILNGLQGPTSSGKAYGIMPPQGAGLSAQDLAYVMTYVRNSFGNKTGDVISPEMAQAALDISAKRSAPGTSVTGAELASHEKDLEGTKIDAAQLVDPITLKPVEKK